MTVRPHPFDIAPVAQAIWAQKYQLRDNDRQAIDGSVEATWARIADAAASVERGGKRVRSVWSRKFADAMSDFGFLPAGRIIAGAGVDRNVTLFNCFVMGEVADDLSAIFASVSEAALTMQAGGGIGQDFSTLRPKGALVRSIGADASGPVSFMEVWDAMCRTIMSAGARRGAMMATMRCDHPDIETFIAAKAEAGRLRNFNLSVLVTDKFVAAVRADAAWELVFDGRVYATVRARQLWERIMRATYDYAEPGVIFIDRINAANNLAYCEDIRATNPCGEQPLPPYGACLLGSINLTRFVDDPFGPKASMDVTAIEARVRLAVRLLDNMIDLSRYPLDAQAKEARAKRRIGLGVTGLADALIMCGMRYGEAAALKAAGAWMAAVQNAAYAASAELAAEKGTFPLYDAAKFIGRPNVQALRPDTRALVAKHGVRNGCLTSIAPTGTISLLAGNVSSGIEPVFDFSYRRRIREADGSSREVTVEDYAFALHKQIRGDAPKRTGAFVAAGDLRPAEHLAMQAALQPHVDSSISKTINCPVDLPFTSFQDIYLQAYDLGLKGCTTFRPNAVTGSVLTAAPVAVVVPVSQTSAAAIAAPAENSAVVYMSKPLERDAVLAGFTYKLTWPGQDNALYVTINDIERGGRLCPFEIFINTKNLEHYAWTVALTRMISAIFRRGGDLAFVVEELKAIFDPQGGRWMEGRYVPSLLAAIGEVIELHMIRIGFMRPVGGDGTEGNLGAKRKASMADRSGPVAGEGAGSKRAAVMIEPVGGEADRAPERAARHVGRVCPRCAGLSLIRAEGCWSCQSCGYARCE